ncbi:MAG: hypothetical protein JXB32_03205 [Deltaproteobacteria bacterium]|nr:hypothetical protein [Deltaproteobacteria bacterium]
MIRPTSVAVMLVLCAACGGGGGTPDTGGETADVPEDRPDGGADADVDAEDDDGGDVGADADADAVDAEDDAADAPDDDGADVPEASKRSVLTVTAGGGTARGGSYGLTLSIGTPQPMGTGSSTRFRGALGPGAVLDQ